MAKNRLLSIAGVAMAGPEVQLDDAFEVMVAQVDVGGANAAVVHGLVSNDLAGGLPEDEAAARFLAFAGDAVLVAHHAAFDIRMLRKAIATHRGAKIWNLTIDTAQLAERVEVSPMSSNRATGYGPTRGVPTRQPGRALWHRGRGTAHRCRGRARHGAFVPKAAQEGGAPRDPHAR